MTDSHSETTLVETVTTYLSAFDTMDVKTIEALMADEYEHTIAPASLNFPGPLNREQYVAHVAGLKSILSGFPVRAKKVYPNPTLRQVLVWADSDARFDDEIKTKGGDIDWSFQGEYMWLFTMDNSGTKVKVVLEFLDSKKSEHLRVLIGKALELKK